FDGVADGYSVTHGKPAPDIFIFAAGLVSTPTSHCLGVEDADVGIEAIKAAGMQALAIGPAERFHKADKVLPSLADKRLQEMLD
ncbi:MAG: HAD-IA family hydrolase, partial [Ktedonobacteraceae bacterium]|nr:HAD-IA family hydrolase [Ktedonobacteraceae bacterium]